MKAREVMDALGQYWPRSRTSMRACSWEACLDVKEFGSLWRINSWLRSRGIQRTDEQLEYDSYLALEIKVERIYLSKQELLINCYFESHRSTRFHRIDPAFRAMQAQDAYGWVVRLDLKWATYLYIPKRRNK